MPGSTTATILPVANSNVPFVPTAPNVGGAGSLWQALADASDATYLTSGSWAIRFDVSGAQDLDYVQNVSFSVRFEQTSVAKTTRTMSLYDPVTNKAVNWSYIVSEATPTTHTSPLFTSIGGTKLTAAVVDRLILYGLFDTGLRMYQARLIVNYNQRPTVSAITPTGTVAVTSPPLSWTYCADEETEVLTRDGWKRYDQASTDDHLLTLDHETGLSEWQQPSAINVFDAMPRQMIRMEGTRHSSLTTPNHRWPVETYTQHRKGERPRFDIRRFRETADLRWGDRIPCAVPCRDLPAEPKYADDLVELVAWFWTEGEILPGGGLRIVQSLKVNDPYVARIRRCLMRLYGPEAVGSMNRGGGYRLVEPLWKEGLSRPEMARFALNKAAAQPVLDAAPGKVVSPAFIAALTEAQLRLFVETSIDADGCRSRSRRSIGQNSEERLDPFEMACALLGIRTTRHEWASSYWTVQLHRGNYIRPRLAASHKVAFSITEETYSGHVWCPTTPNKTWLARRRGTVYWTGNTDPESDPQEAVDVVIVDAATVAKYTMTSAPTHLDEAAFVASHFLTTSTSFSSDALVLVPGDYRVFIRAFDQGSNFAIPYTWGVADFTIATVMPPPPKVVVTAPYSEPFGRVALAVQGFTNLLSANQASAEGTTADYAVTNATPTLDATATGLWSPPTGPTVSTKSLKLVLTSTATATAATPATLATGVTVVAGSTYTAGAHVFSPVERLATAAIQWVNASNALISTTTGHQTPTAAGSEPAPVFVTGVAPAGAVRAVVLMSIIGSLNTEAHYLDDWVLVPDEAGPLTNSILWPGNLVANTSFETYAGSSGAADWNLVDNGAGQTVAVITDAYNPAEFGPQSMNVAKAETSLAPPYIEWPNLAGSVPRLPVTAGDVVIVVGLQSAAPGVTVEAVYQDATHDQVTCTPVSANWEKFVAAFQIPSGKTGVSFRFLPVAVGANASSGTAHVDMINIAFANTAAVTLFHALGGASGTPLGAGTTTANLALAMIAQLWFPWTPGGQRASLTYTVERSDDAGVTWTTVPGLPAPGTDLSAAGYDYGATPNARILYRASAQAIDGAGNVITSAPTVGLPDPGFEQQSWTGMSTDPFASQFQAPVGRYVGALDGSTASLQAINSFKLPTYSLAAVGVRFLARAINCPTVNVQVRLFDRVGAVLSATNVPVTSVAGADTGWRWHELSSLAIPASAHFLDLFVFNPAAVDGAQPVLFAMDNVIVWTIDAAGLANSVATPSCVQWLKDPQNPGANLQVHIDTINLQGSGNAAAAGLESSSIEPQLVMQPSGRGTPVVLADTIDAEVFGTLQLTLESDAEWRTFETLRKAQRPLLLQLPYGDLVGEQYYIRLGDVRSVGRISTQRQSTQQLRRVSIAARQVDAP